MGNCLEVVINDTTKMVLYRKYYYFRGMSNPRLSRQILFQKGKTTEEPEKEVKKTAPAKRLETPQKPAKSTSKDLYDWLDSHELINLAGLCRLAGVDKSNFLKRLGKNKELPRETLAKFSKILSDYGY